jgi:hypothetical protein
VVITVWVHPVDTDRFPMVAPGSWRWCVGVGTDPADKRMWLNAWVCAPGESQLYDPRTDALIEGSQHGATVAAGLRLAGVDPVDVQPGLLEHDPCPDDSYDQQLKMEG